VLSCCRATGTARASEQRSASENGTSVREAKSLQATSELTTVLRVSQSLTSSSKRCTPIRRTNRSGATMPGSSSWVRDVRACRTLHPALTTSCASAPSAAVLEREIALIDELLELEPASKCASLTLLSRRARSLTAACL
jgi:hypothetical protein